VAAVEMWRWWCGIHSPVSKVTIWPRKVFQSE